MPLNLHRVFVGSTDNNYLSALAVKKQKEDSLRAARDEIRATLRAGLGNLAQFSRDQLFEVLARDSAPASLKPKFRMQGSFSYRTCNDPAHKPPQEVDLDDGMFLPVSFLRESSGRAHPILVSKGLFAATEQALAPLCKARGWQIVSKPSCVRIEIHDDAHVDIALYAIPDNAYQTLVEKALMAESALARDSVRKELADATELSRDLYEALSGEQIMLAHRDEGWKPSDPRKLEDWFKNAVDSNGEHLRRVCRYLKGWRDYRWEDEGCRLSSIILMAAVVNAFEANPTLAGEPNRDDKALLAVCDRLSAFLSAGVRNPVLVSQRLDENWTTSQRREYLSAASELAAQIRAAALGTNSPAIAIAELKKAFGDRIPNNPTLISDDSGLELKSVVAAPAIVGLSNQDRMRRAELAAREVETRGVQSKPWLE